MANRDIKLENALLDANPRPLLKICDFGYSKVSIVFRNWSACKTGGDGCAFNRAGCAPAPPHGSALPQAARECPAGAAAD